MNETALIASKEAIKSANGFFSKIVNPACGEIGELLADNIRLYRFRKQLDLLVKAENILKEKGVDPKRVDLKTLIPILNDGSLEEDESMVTRWAMLLASAADPTGALVLPAFPSILRELSSVEAKMLDFICRNIIELNIPSSDWNERGIKGKLIMDWLKIDSNHLEIYSDNLIRLGLCSLPSTRFEFTTTPETKYIVASKEIICLTHLGYEFVQTCTSV